jgi:dihydrofolate reductase
VTTRALFNTKAQRDEVIEPYGAVERARETLGRLLGGAEIIRQCIRGLLDELRLHVVHIVLGGGTALFGGLGPADVALERIGLIDADGATHFTFRLVR